MEINDILNKAMQLGACQKASRATDWSSLARLFFSPQGVEFCKKHNYPSLEMFQQMGDISELGIYVNTDCNLKNTDVALIGDAQYELHFLGTEKPYKVILMYGAKAKIYASMYAVVKVEDISGGCEIFNDGTATIL